MKRISKVFICVMALTVLLTAYSVKAFAASLQKPKITSAQSVSYNSACIKWGKVTGAESYIVYRSTDNKTWKKLTTTKAVSYTDKGLTCGTVYYYTLRASAGGKTSGYNSGVAVKPVPATPKISSATGKATNTVAVTWNKVAGASGYILYRSSKSTSGWTKTATVKSGSTVTYSDKTCSAGKVYYYTVKAYRTVNGKTVTGGYQKTGTAGISLPSTVKLSSATSQAYNSIKLTWKSVSGATSYKIYRKYGSQDWSYLAKTNGNKSVTYTDTSCTTGTPYTYTVRAVVTCGGKSSVGGFDKKGVTGTALPSKPVLSSADAVAYNSVTVSWKAVSGSTHYYIYRKTDSTGWGKIVKVTKANTKYTDKTCLTGTKYTYTVRAAVDKNGKSYKGGYDANGVSAVPKLSVPQLIGTSSAATDCITVKYGSVSGADGYIIYRKTYDADYKKIAEVTKPNITSYTDKTALCGNAFTYTVKAYRNVNGKKVYSGYNSTGIQGRAIVSAPVIKSTSVSGKGIVITLNPDSRISYYNIYRYRTDGKESEYFAGTVSSGKYTFTDYTATAGITYRYKAKAYITTENGDAESDMSGFGDSIYMPFSVPYIVSASITDGCPKLKFDCEGAVLKYIVYRAENGGKVFEKLGETENSYYTDSSAVYGIEYVYRVSAVFDCEGTPAESGLSNPTGTITLTLNIPTITSAYIQGKGAVISFTGDGNADEYRIYRSVNGAEPTFLCSTTETSYTDREIYYGNSYTYTVSACKNSHVTLYQTEQSKPSNTVVFDLNRPNINSAEISGQSSAVLSFVSDINAQGYRIYRHTQNTDWVLLGETVMAVYTDNSLKYGESYQYAVTAFAEDIGGVYETPKGTASSTVTVLPPAPVISGSRSDTEKIYITFKPQKNVYTYKIYRSNKLTSWSVTDTIELEDTESNFTFEDTSAQYGITYNYSISGVAENGKEGERSESLSEGISLKLPVSEIVGINVADGKSFVIECKALPSADGYKLYRSCSGEDFTEIGYINGNTVKSSTFTFTDNTAAPFSLYGYAVTAVFNGQESDRSAVFNKEWTPTAPKLTVSFVPENAGYELSWTSEYNSDTYKVYRKAADGNYTLLTSTSKTKYTDINVSFKSDYTYKVAAEYTKSDKSTGTLESGEASARFSEKSPTALWIRKARDNKNFIAFSADDGNGNRFDKFYIYRSDNGSYFTYIGCQTNPNAADILYYKDSVTGNNCTYCVIAQDGDITTKTDASFISGITKLSGLEGVTVTTGDNDIRVIFTPINGCTEYSVYRAKNYTTAFEFISSVQTVGSAPVTYIDTRADLNSGIANYYYSVIPSQSVTYFDFNSNQNMKVELSCVHNTSAYCTVGVNPADITRIAPSGNGTYIAWNKLNGASGYKLYRSDSENGEYTCIKELGSDITEYIDAERPFLTKCRYKVLTYAVVDGKLTESKDTVGVCADFSLNSEPIINDVFVGDDGNVYIDCSTDVYDASSYIYYLFRRDSTDGSLSCVGYQKRYNGNNTEIMFCDSGAADPAAGEYTVIASNGIKYSQVSTELFPVNSFAPMLSIQMLSKDGYCKISTEFDSRSDTVRIYRRAEDDTDWELIKTHQNYGSSYLTYNDTGVKEGHTYYYKATAEKSGEYGLFSYTATAESDIKGPVQRQVSDVITTAVQPYEDEATGLLYPTICWEKAANVSGYRVYRRYVSGDYVLISGEEPITEPEYTDKTVFISSLYTYAVEAVYNVNGKIICSDYQNSVIKADFSAGSPNFRTTGLTESDTIGFEWNDISSTALCKYYIYRRVHGTDTWQLVTAKMSADSQYYPSYYDIPPKHNVTYDYTMCAFVYDYGEDNMPYYSMYSGFDNESSIISVSYDFHGMSVRYIAPAETSGEVDDYRPKICWYANLNCDGYILMRKSSQNGTWQQIAQIEDGSGMSYITYTDTSASYFDNYYYSVAVYNDLSDGTREISDYDTDGTSPKDGVTEIFNLLNKHRLENGADELVFSDTLWKLATMRSVEISQSFSHTRPDGSDCYTAAAQFGISYMSAAENIASSYSLSQEYAFNQWKNSAGHNANMISQDLGQVGIGFYYAGSGMVYWTQFFTN